MTVTILLLGFACAWLLAFVGAALWSWTLGGALLLLLLALFDALSPGALIVLAALGALLALLLHLPALRRNVLSAPALRVFRKVLPEMSRTEREVLEAGDVWWEAELFRGRPDWQKLLDFSYTALTAEEQSFLDHECEALCALCDDWRIEYEQKDLPQAAWDYIRERKFFAMLIRKEFGGLGFSALAQSAVVTKLASKSVTLAVTVMVPNSLGPGELLMRYGTEAQRAQWLPRLVSGEAIPCFGLTGPEVGSDATAMPDLGVVGYGEHQGQRIVGLYLSFSKRYITLAPVATVIGLAFKLRDPQGLLGDPARIDYGITCILLPADHPGVHVGRRHYPGAAFMNGTIHGRQVFVPLDAIIGGVAMAGKGWRMLSECLSAGRGISLPALSTAAGQLGYRMVGVYARMRRQFKVAIGKFEGVQEATGRIAGFTYTLEAMRLLTASAVDHCAPSVATAIAKYQMTELMRIVVSSGMDVLAGKAIQQGPRNFMATGFKVMPVAITVEGANILTRNLMIYGQGAIRCHRYVFEEMEAAHAGDLKKFDRLLFAHLGFAVNRAVRAFTLALSGARLARSPLRGELAPYFRQLERCSAALAFASDLTMGVLGGRLKFMERLSARLGDVLSQLYIASAVLKFYLEGSRSPAELAHARWALEHCLYEIGQALGAFVRNFPVAPARWLLRLLLLPLGNPYAPVSDRVNAQVADLLLEASDVRERLGGLVFKNGGPHDPVGRMEQAWQVAEECERAYLKFFHLANADALRGDSVAERLDDALARQLLTAAEVAQARRYDEARYEVILTDDFSKEYLAGDFAAESAERIEQAGLHARVA
ncbi:acyl-CoA dehydrogenase [Solimonas aquatica]|uniref:Acyl-coenzyme A dehydrogenase n=1 Tax=Solimonas aquatica TaxID=489703 RepID=A0A1H9J8D8_9GAMM|nr:acyl-CoA dehydrogenase [Solimonas aquatica]SEQ83291.1 acyl-CoA dehydrogenase [Solimonas aquatica]